MTESHHHHHGSDYSCGSCGTGHPHHSHDMDGAERLVEEALVLSHSWSGTSGSPEMLAARMREGLLHLARLVSEYGVVFGHLKALLRCGPSTLACSVTRVGVADETASPDWPPCGPADWSLTVNILSLFHTDTVTEELLDNLFG